MTKRTSIDLTFAALTFLFIGLSIWDPAHTIWQEAPLVTVLIGSWLSFALARREHGVASRGLVWMWPVLALLLAVQVAWSSDAEHRVASGLLGAGLLVASSALAVMQRRAT